MNTVVHVGLGKTATSSLQAHVFPRLAGGCCAKSYNPLDVVEALDRLLHTGLGLDEVRRAVGERSGLFLSHEVLSEWDPELWEVAADRNLAVFGSNASIVLTLRDHRSYLRSLYQQAVHSGKICRPEEFFLSAEIMNRVRRFVRAGELEVFNVDAFHMRRLVELYTQRFEKVIVVPMQSIGKFEFLTELWPIEEQRLQLLKEAFASAPALNSSYSALAMWLTLRREAILRAAGVRSLSETDRLRDRYCGGGALKPKRSGFRVPSWSWMMRLVTRIGPASAYELPEYVSVGRNFEDNEVYYNGLLRSARGYLVHGADGMMRHQEPAAVESLASVVGQKLISGGKVKPKQLSIAAIQQELTTARYFELAALAQGIELTRVTGAVDTRKLHSADFLLVVDPWGADLEGLAAAPCKTAAYLIDVHQEMESRLLMARYVDHVFVAQPEYIPEFTRIPHPSVHWLPLGCDPNIHFVDGLERDIDIGFVGKLGLPGSERRAILERLLSQFATNPQGVSYSPREMGTVYSRSKIVINKSINNDVNMRVFEAMASGALLITDRIGNGLPDIAVEGEHYIGYDSVNEAIDAINHFLENSVERHRIARAGQILAFEKHTYSNRLETIVDVVCSDPVLHAPARQASPREERLWLARWHRLRGVGIADGLKILRSGRMPLRGALDVGVGIARGISRNARALLSTG